jgi:DNA helicase-2/ATP-dependent DNA helicase PcrA
MVSKNLDIKQYKPNAISYMISAAKNDFVSPQDYGLYNSGFIEDIVADIYPEYQKHLETLNALDFGDLLYQVVRLFKESPETLERYQDMYQYMMVDEYQDTNKVQYLFVKMLSDKYKNICVVGDDDQGIYAWRGADIKNIISFEKDFPGVKVVKLEQNYRSVGNVIQAAVAVISGNNNRVEKKLWTDKDSGDPIVVYQAEDDKSESQYVVDEVLDLQRKGYQLNDIAVLYRTNFQSRVIEEAFLRNSVPYKLVGGFRFYERKEIKDIISYLRFCFNLKDELSIDRIINTPSRKIGLKSLSHLHELSKEAGCTLGEFLVSAYLVSSSNTGEVLDNRFSESLLNRVAELKE